MSAAPQSKTIKENTLESIDASLVKYETRRAAILEKAFQEGGGDKVKELEDEYQALQDAYFELLNRQLAANSAKFPDLMKQAVDATKQINASVDSLNNVTSILSSITKTVNLIGRVLILFGA
jgi:hypothetical protein